MFLIPKFGIEIHFNVEVVLIQSWTDISLGSGYKSDILLDTECSNTIISINDLKYLFPC